MNPEKTVIINQTLEGPFDENGNSEPFTVAEMSKRTGIELIKVVAILQEMCDEGILDAEMGAPVRYYVNEDWNRDIQ